MGIPAIGIVAVLVANVTFIAWYGPKSSSSVHDHDHQQQLVHGLMLLMMTTVLVPSLTKSCSTHTLNSAFMYWLQFAAHMQGDSPR